MHLARLIVLDVGLLKCKQQKSMFGAAEGSHETYNFHYGTHQRDVICQILKFLFAACDVCQIIQPPVSLYYLLTSALTVWRIKTQALNTPSPSKGILHQMGGR